MASNNAIPSILNNVASSNKDLGETMSQWANSFDSEEKQKSINGSTYQICVLTIVANSSKRKCQLPSCNNIETDTQFKQCAKCSVPYCSRLIKIDDHNYLILYRDCQVQHWKDGHKTECATFVTLQTNRNEVVKNVLTDLLFYISPCVVSNFLRKGRGVLFAFTEQPLQQYIDVQMKKPGNYDRQLILQYFTEQELVDVFLKRIGVINSSTQDLMSK